MIKHTKHSETKNLPIVYQKLFNMALKRCKSKVSEPGNTLDDIIIRSCSSVVSIKRLMMKYSELQQAMIQMFESGELLKNLIRWNGHYSNMAIALKFYNRLQNIVKNPQTEGNQWIVNMPTVAKVQLSENAEVNRVQSKSTVEENNKQAIKLKLRENIIIPEPKIMTEQVVEERLYPEFIPLVGFRMSDTIMKEYSGRSSSFSFIGSFVHMQ